MNSYHAVEKRYKKHLVAISGAQTADAFSASPYFKKSTYSDGAWFWLDDKMRADQAILAKAYIDSLESLNIGD